MKRFATLSLYAGLLLPASNAAAQVTPAPLQLPARMSYAAKFVCGLQQSVTSASSTPKEPIVKKGNYATVINIHNPNAIEVSILKKVALAARENYPNTTLIVPTRRYPDRLPSDHAMAVDCTEIVNLLQQNGTPPMTSFIEGFLVIDSLSITGAALVIPELDVVSVTTTAVDATSAVNNIHIMNVEGKKLPAGTWPF